MGDFDDMNATPLGKLPMPTVQSKTDGPRIDGNTSYTDILKNMSNESSAPSSFAHPVASQAYQQQSYQQQAYQQQPYQQQQPFPASMPSSQYYAPPSKQKKQVKIVKKRYDSSSSSESESDAGRRYTGKNKSWLARVREYKTSILVTVIVFVVLLYVSPRLAQLVPRLLTPVGKFNIIGLLVISSMCGGIHRVADTYVRSN